MQLRRGLLALASAQCAAAEESPGGNCTDGAADVLCAPETGLSECADVVAYFNLTAGAAPVSAAGLDGRCSCARARGRRPQPVAASARAAAFAEECASAACGGVRRRAGRARGGHLGLGQPEVRARSARPKRGAWCGPVPLTMRASP